MSEIVVPLASDVELRMSRQAARRLWRQLDEELERSPRPMVGETASGLVLPDDHPLWEQHTGLGGHRDHPEWVAAADQASAEAFYQPLRGKAKVLFDILIDHPGQQLTVHDICRLSGGVFTGSRSIAGAINGLRLSYEASGRRYPFYWWEGRPARYAMKASVANLFRQVRDGLTA
jgi:hypothetical protein